MSIRTLAVAGLLLGLQTTSMAQDPVLPPITPAHYVEADLIRLNGLLGLNPAQVEECRIMLMQHETAVFKQRETIRRETAALEMQQPGTYQSLVRALNPEQREKLNRALKDGKLPFSMETAEPGSARGSTDEAGEAAPKTKPAKQGSPTSPTTLSR